MRLSRRQVLKSAIKSSVLAGLWPRTARAQANAVAKRAIFFYFPDGVAAESQQGEPSLWHATGSERSFTLSEQMMPLARHQSACLFFTGLSLGATDSGSHPGGAKKLLTGADGGNGESIDHFLSRTAGASAPHRFVHLGAMANANNASGDKHITYATAGQSIAPEDDPLRAFDRIFTGSAPPVSGPRLEVSVIDGVLAEMNAFRAKLGSIESAKLERHLESLREVERRIKNASMPMSSCEMPARPGATFPGNALYEPERFPEILRLQIDLLVEAMACGLTKVGTIQGSQHTSELIMSRFANTEMHDPGFDMRSHQASHYGAAHDRSRREFTDYLKQRRWWVEQFAYLLDKLAGREEEGGTMLDNSIVLLCTEVCDGNTHLHDNMPFILAGRAAGRIDSGRLLSFGYERHGKLLVSIAHAMGQNIAGFGDSGDHGALAGVLR